MVEREHNGNGEKRERWPDLIDATDRRAIQGTFRRPAQAGEADMLGVPVRLRLRWGWRSMVRESAKLLGARTESRLRYMPVAALVFSVVLALAAAVMAYGVFRGRTDATAEAMLENQRATAALVTASEARLTAAANELRQSARDLKAELGGQIASIDGKVQSIQGSVASQQTALAELRADLRAANEDKGRLWQQIETEKLKRERIERELAAIKLSNPE